ncbi:hypothetical protein TNCV_1673471 [Trichonephila clavipes]|nr:hypothetical protein TNCV_1673471 [Trichonephila clavipes]
MLISIRRFFQFQRYRRSWSLFSFRPKNPFDSNPISAGLSPNLLPLSSGLSSSLQVSPLSILSFQVSPPHPLTKPFKHQGWVHNATLVPFLIGRPPKSPSHTALGLISVLFVSEHTNTLQAGLESNGARILV